MSPKLKPAEVWYNKNIASGVKASDKLFRMQLASTSLTDEEKAKMILIGNLTWHRGCHQWYLRIHMNTYNTAIDIIKVNRLWDMPLKHCSSFEDVYVKVEKLLTMKFIGQLTIYDVAIRIIVAQSETRLMPKDYVYVHAKPRAVYKDLQSKGYIKYKPKGWNVKISMNDLPEFAGMSPLDIEILLCEIGKGHYSLVP